MHDDNEDLWERLDRRIVSDPQGLKEEILDAARRKNPHLTEANLQAQWEHCAQLFDIDA